MYRLQWSMAARYYKLTRVFTWSDCKFCPIWNKIGIFRQKPNTVFRWHKVTESLFTTILQARLKLVLKLYRTWICGLETWLRAAPVADCCNDGNRARVLQASGHSFTTVIELLMMGGKTPETCWAVNKRQDNKLKNCCIRLVIYSNCTMMHGLSNLKFYI